MSEAWGDVDETTLRLDGVILDVNIRSAITGATIKRTIDGAPTLTLDLADVRFELVNSGIFNQRVTMQVDQYSFELASVQLAGTRLSLVFEEATVAVLRRMDTPRKVEKGTITRADFIKSLIADASPSIKFVTIPGGDLAKTEMSRGTPYQAASAGSGSLLMDDTIVIPTSGGDASSGTGGAAAIDAFMNAIAGIESGGSADPANAANARTGAAGLYQILPSNWGPWAVEAGLAFDAPKTPHNQYLVAKFQMLKYFRQFNDWGTVAVGWYAGPGKMSLWQQNPYDPFFTRGFGAGNREPSVVTYVEKVMKLFAKNRGLPVPETPDFAGSSLPTVEIQEKREGTWEAIGRLADDVGWRRYIRNPNEVVYVPEGLGALGPAKWKIGPHTSGIIDVSFDHDIGKNESKIGIKCFANRWVIPPGDHVSIAGNWPVSGPNWIVSSIERSLFSKVATIQLVRPRPTLPEPEGAPDQADDGLEGLLDDAIIIPGDTGPGGGIPYAPGTNSTLEGFQWPTDVRIVTSSFGKRNGRDHKGIDIGCPKGSAVRAAQAGTVYFVGEQPTGYGKYVIVNHADGTSTRYAHLLQIIPYRGLVVPQGHTLGFSGGVPGEPGSGNSRGAHLHFEVRKNGNAVDPMGYLP